MTAGLVTDEKPRTDGREVLCGSELTSRLRLGEAQVEGPLAIFPLFITDQDMEVEDAPRYVALGQALADGSVTISEVSEGGSVPDVLIVNESDDRILILDGQELRGARQNRAASTSILIDARSTLIIPVSCVEQGRWAYSSSGFADSEVVAERRVRWAMKDSTHASLLAGTGHRPAQARVWVEVERLQRKHAMTSPTGAMRDVYARRKRELDHVLASLPLLDGQTGLLVTHGSRVVGMDLVSRAPQYAEWHDKLLRSYAFEALLRGGEPGDNSAAEEFLERVGGLEGHRFSSPGLGSDVRFEGDGLLGSALEFEGHALHAAFFDVGGATESEDDTPLEDRPNWHLSDARERARQHQAR